MIETYRRNGYTHSSVSPICIQSVPKMSNVCRHGEEMNCPDCYVYELEDLRNLLTHPNAQYIMNPRLKQGLLCRVEESLKSFKKAEAAGYTRKEPHVSVVSQPKAQSIPRRVSSPQSHSSSAQKRVYPVSPPPFVESESVDEDDELFFSAQSTIPRNKFRPSIVHGSAFGDGHFEEPYNKYRRTSDPGPRQPTIPSYPIVRPPSRQRKWLPSQVAMLMEGYSAYGSRWETIRAAYPNLAEFTGVQLKDKYRHIMGR